MSKFVEFNKKNPAVSSKHTLFSFVVFAVFVRILCVYVCLFSLVKPHPLPTDLVSACIPTVLCVGRCFAFGCIMFVVNRREEKQMCVFVRFARFEAINRRGPFFWKDLFSRAMLCCERQRERVCVCVCVFVCLSVCALPPFAHLFPSFLPSLQLIPLFAVAGIGMVGAGLYILRMCTKGYDVVWTRQNPYPWQKVSQTHDSHVS